MNLGGYGIHFILKKWFSIETNFSGFLQENLLIFKDTNKFSFAFSNNIQLSKCILSDGQKYQNVYSKDTHTHIHTHTHTHTHAHTHIYICVFSSKIEKFFTSLCQSHDCKFSVFIKKIIFRWNVQFRMSEHF